jgi:hypothetical protein
MRFLVSAADLKANRDKAKSLVSEENLQKLFALGGLPKDAVNAQFLGCSDQNLQK